MRYRAYVTVQYNYELLIDETSEDNAESRIKGMSDEEINALKVNEDRQVTVTQFEEEE